MSGSQRIHFCNPFVLFCIQPLSAKGLPPAQDERLTIGSSHAVEIPTRKVITRFRWGGRRQQGKSEIISRFWATSKQGHRAYAHAGVATKAGSDSYQTKPFRSRSHRGGGTYWGDGVHVVSSQTLPDERTSCLPVVVHQNDNGQTRRLGS